MGPYDSVATPAMNSQLARLQARMAQQRQRRPFGAGYTSFSAPNSGTFGMGAPSMGSAIVGAAPPLPAGMQMSLPPMAADPRGARNAYGLRSMRNFTPAQNAPVGSGVLGTFGSPDDRMAATLNTIGGKHVLMGGNAQRNYLAGQSELGSQGSLRQVMRNSQEEYRQSPQFASLVERQKAMNAMNRQRSSDLRAMAMARNSGVRLDKAILARLGGGVPSPVASKSAEGGFTVPPTDQAAQALAGVNPAGWGVYGVRDFHEAGPDQFVSAMRSPEWIRSTPEGRAARIRELQNRLASGQFQQHPYTPELMALMNGQPEGADIERSLRAAPGGFAGIGAEKQRMRGKQFLRSRPEAAPFVFGG